MIKYLTLTIAFFLLISTTRAQWKNVGPEGGMVYKVISKSGVLISFTAGGLYRSTDNGDNWVPSNTNLPDEITAILTHNNKFYASTKLGIYSSADGLVWAIIPNGNFQGKVFYSNGTQLFVVFSGKVYNSINDGGWQKCGGAYTVSDPAMVLTNSTLYLGTDNGVWSSFNNGLSFSGGSVSVPGGIYDIKVMSPNFLLISSTAGLYKWNGTTTLSNNGLGGRTAGRIMMLNNKYIVSANSPSALFPILFSSTDATNWTPVPNLPTTIFLSMDYIASTAFVGSSIGIHRSTDNGVTWVKKVSGIKAQNVIDVKSANNKVYAVLNNRLKNGMNGGIYTSADDGANWQRLSLDDTFHVEKIAIQNDTIVAYTHASNWSPQGAFYRSTDGGATWVKLNKTPGSPEAFYHTNKTLFITGFGINGTNIERSMDMGTTWQTVTLTGYTGTNTTPLAIMDVIGSTIYAISSLNVSAGGGVFKSDDNGVTWVAVNNGLGGSIANARAAGNNLFAYINAFSGISALFRSTNLGVSWEQINSALQSYILQDINSGNGSLYVSAAPANYGTDSGYIYESSDNGNTWNNITANLPTITLGRTVVNNSKVYVATMGYSLFTKNAPALPVTFISISANRVTAGVQVNWKVAAETDMLTYEVERSTNGRTFITAQAVSARNTPLQNTYTVTDVNTPAGTLYYRIKSIAKSGEVKYTAIVKLNADRVSNGFTVSPNPAQQTGINVQFKNQPAGAYSVRLLNITGQVVFTKMVAHAGGSSNHTLYLPQGTSFGNYQLEITAPGKTIARQAVMIAQ